MVRIVGGKGNEAWGHYIQQVNLLQADVAALRTQLNTHVHSGVTVGAGNSGAPTTTAGALTSDQLVARVNDGT